MHRDQERSSNLRQDSVNESIASENRKESNNLRPAPPPDNAVSVRRTVSRETEKCKCETPTQNSSGPSTCLLIRSKLNESRFLWPQEGRQWLHEGILSTALDLPERELRNMQLHARLLAHSTANCSIDVPLRFCPKAGNSCNSLIKCSIVGLPVVAFVP